MTHYIANKTMNLSGKEYQKGTEVPQRVFNKIAPYRQDALVRTKLIIEVDAMPKPPGEDCPHCDEGPFQRLAQHISLKHEDIKVEVSETAADEIPEESDGNS